MPSILQNLASKTKQPPHRAADCRKASRLGEEARNAILVYSSRTHRAAGSEVVESPGLGHSDE